jgi:hypothetical protein
MRLGIEKYPVKQAIYAPESRVCNKPLTLEPQFSARTRPCETLIERVVDFIDTYSEN